MYGGFQELLDEFLLEAQERSDEVEGLLLRLAAADMEERQSVIVRTKRELHTLKGNSGMMGFSDLQQLAHMMEDQVELLDLENPQVDDLLAQLDELRRGLEAVRSPIEEPEEPPPAAAPPAILLDEPSTDSPTQPTETPQHELDEPVDIAAEAVRESLRDGPMREAGSVRVPFAKIDGLVEGQAETLIFRNRLSDTIERGTRLLQESAGRLPDDLVHQFRAAWENVEHSRQALEKTLHTLQEQVTDLGMVPLQGLFRSLGRIVHDESRREGKRIGLEIRGGETPIDRTLLETAGEALGHLVRNAVIHGIEAPASRIRSGKHAEGQIEVSANLEGSEVRIDITDDGGGIDIDALEAKARTVRPELLKTTRGLDLLFADGISTRQATDLGAGRGVGLAAVKKSVESHGGRIRVHSLPTNGTTFSLHLPVTAAIIRSLLLEVDEEVYALPLGSVAESLRVAGESIHELNHSRVLRWRGELVPLLDVGLSFATSHSATERSFSIIIDVGGRRRGLLIDRLVGIRDIVVKGLDDIVGKPPGISGSTILGDGRVIMILDPMALVSLAPTLVRARL